MTKEYKVKVKEKQSNSIKITSNCGVREPEFKRTERIILYNKKL